MQNTKQNFLVCKHDGTVYRNAHLYVTNKSMKCAIIHNVYSKFNCDVKEKKAYVKRRCVACCHSFFLNTKPIDNNKFNCFK